VRVAVLEAGHWHARMYVEALRGLHVEVAAVSDRDPSAAARAAGELGCTRSYADYREALERGGFDFAFAFGRHCDMPAIARELIERGVPFAMEKPVACSAPEVTALAAKAEAKGLFAAVALVQRSTPAMQLVAGWLAAGELGPLTHCCMRYIAGPPSRYPQTGCGWMLDPDLSGGGCTINLAVHYVDLFMYLTGKRPRRVFATMNNLTHGLAIEDSSTIVISAEDGTSATIETGYTRPGSLAEEYHAFASTDGYVTVKDDVLRREDRGGRRTEHDVRKGNVYVDFVRDCLGRSSRGEAPATGLREMEAVMKSVELACRSSREHKVLEAAE
jgi:predicted dehydrogenase